MAQQLDGTQISQFPFFFFRFTIPSSVTSCIAHSPFSFFSHTYMHVLVLCKQLDALINWTATQNNDYNWIPMNYEYMDIVKMWCRILCWLRDRFIYSYRCRVEHITCHNTLRHTTNQQTTTINFKHIFPDENASDAKQHDLQVNSAESNQFEFNSNSIFYAQR